MSSAILYAASAGIEVGVYGDPMALESDHAVLGGVGKPRRMWPEMHQFSVPDGLCRGGRGRGARGGRDPAARRRSSTSSAGRRRSSGALPPPARRLSIEELSVCPSAVAGASTARQPSRPAAPRRDRADLSSRRARPADDEASTDTAAEDRRHEEVEDARTTVGVVR